MTNKSFKEVQKVDPKKRTALLAMMKKANEKAKHRVMAFAEDVESPYMLRRPSGVMGLDIDLAGGLPAGTLNVFSGPEGAGKTAMMFKYMAMQQRIFGDACVLALAPIENKVDHFFMRKCGLQVAIPDEVIEQKQEERKRLGLPPMGKEEVKGLKTKIGDFILVNEDTAEQTLDQVIELTRTKAVNMIGVDSFSAFQTTAEMNTDSLGDNPRQAAMAGTLTRFQQRMSPLFSSLDDPPNTTTVIGICQVRANRERANMNPAIQKYIAPYIPSIPYAIKHMMTMSLLFYPGEKIKEGKKGESKTQTGKVMKWRVDKGKAGVHEGIQGEVEYEFDEAIDDVGSVVTEAYQRGIFVEKNGVVSLHSHTGDVIWKDIGSLKVVREGLATDVEFEMKVRTQILAAAGKSCLYW